MLKFASLAASGAAILAFASAHPGDAHRERSLSEMAASQLFHANAHRSLAACSHSAGMRELQMRAASRRHESVNKLRDDRRRLSAADVVATDHKSSVASISPDTVDPEVLFGSTPKCVLEPEVTQGPYYVTGELIRNDVRESEPGIDLYVELQFVDINTCTPVPEYYVDFWHSNSSGVYAGVVANGNGNGADPTNINTTHSRGIYPTDAEGVVQFVTKFPGHYDGRATHIHILGNHNGTVLPNNTYAGGSAASVGQIFFDQSLLDQVNTISPYSTIDAPVVVNEKDSIFVQAAATGFDPIVEYVLLGDKLDDGVFAWISVGVDLTVYKSVGAAAIWTANGGVANAGGFGGGPGGGGGLPGNGSFPGPPGNGPPGSGSASPSATPNTL